MRRTGRSSASTRAGLTLMAPRRRADRSDVAAHSLAVAARTGARARRGARPALALGLAALLVSWAILSLVSALSWDIGDVVLYRHWGRLVAAGRVPYRDFPLEYPPGAVLVFALPAWLHRLTGALTYVLWFRLELLALWAGMLAAVASALDALGASRRHARLALLVCGASPLLLGNIAVSRYDVWPAFLCAVAVAALLRGRGVAACLAIGAGIDAKLYPAVLLPL